MESLLLLCAGNGTEIEDESRVETINNMLNSAHGLNKQIDGENVAGCGRREHCAPRIALLFLFYFQLMKYAQSNNGGGDLLNCQNSYIMHGCIGDMVE